MHDGATSRVGDVLELRRTVVEVDPLKEYTLIGVYSFGKGILHREPRLGAELGNYRFFEVRPGDLILSNIQAWEGAIAFATQEDLGTIGTHRFLTYVPRDGLVDPNWARYFFLSERGFALIQQAAPGTVKRNRTLSIARFEELKIPLPDINEQRRIAAWLDGIARRLSRVEDLHSLSSSLKRAFAMSLLSRDAETLQMGKLVSQKRRLELVDPSRTYSLLGVRWYGDGLFNRERKPGSEVRSTKLYRVHEGDFIYNRLFGWKGSFAVAGPEFGGCHVSGEFPTFEVDQDRLDLRYLAAMFSDPGMWKRVEDRSVGGTPTSRNRLKEAAFLEIEIPVPPLDEQQRVSGIIEKLNLIDRTRQQQEAYVRGLRTAALNSVFADLT